uniref:Rab3 GTPase-activating protein catalytic subunit n=1 Tax=Cajanus cajan TaxID=3821 RepID=A0A151SY26_CAJCA|nr:Rab3 GTPase-activating protein catalytic subunit [Cajanus cajan]
MASSSTGNKIHADATDDELTEQEEEEEEELEHFDDFTLASSWERFISEIEAVLRLWMSDGPNNLLEKGAVLLEDSGNLYKVKSEMKYAMKNYCMEFYFKTDPDVDAGKLADWNFDLHDLQLCYGVKEFLVIAPQSASGVVLDAPEASKLLSAIAIALSNCSRESFSVMGLKWNGLQGLNQEIVEIFIYGQHLAYSTLDLSVHNFKVRFAMKLTFRTPPYDEDAKITKYEENLTGEVSSGTQWDDDCSWSQWYSAEDPVKGFELIAIWSEKMIESSMEMAELENDSPHEAEKWLISLRFTPNFKPEGSSGNRIGFASELRLLVDALEMSFEAQFMEDFVSAVENPGSDNLKSSMVIPPPTVRDRVLKELFIEGVQFSDFADSGHKTSRAIKGAPLGSLFAQFCLHSLWFGNCNIRAIAVLWIEFVREVRWCWEELDESVAGDDSHSIQTPSEDFSGKVDRTLCFFSCLLLVVNFLGTQMVSNSMIMLEPPLMTEDMHEERLKAVEAFGDSFNFSAQLEKDILTSDMSAFKAANPDAVFEDFIRWHSPGDWEDDKDQEGIKSSTSSALDIKKSKESWPPRGRLSKRMSEKGNLWRKLWNSAPALPASEQKPLLDPNREGEKVLHYLETLKPHDLLEQMVCTAFRAAADTLSQTSYGELKQMETEMQQLYLTMTSALRPLQVNRLSADSETFENLRRLSVAFEQVEKLLALAASLHRKLIQAPRLSREIFTDYYNFYIQTTGKSLAEDIGEKEFDNKQEVKEHEREVLSNMFVPPTANQSWRKVLSMGNLLNGHEPTVREIIFSLRDRVNGNHYAARSGSVSQQEIETYRMYICGTSNDLRVALSVVSCD